MDCSTPGLHIHHQLPELGQTHVRWVDDAVQPSHPLSSPSPPAFSLSQHEALFQGVSFSHQVAQVLEFQCQHQSFQWIFRADLLGWTRWISLQSKGLSRESLLLLPTALPKPLPARGASRRQKTSKIVESCLKFFPRLKTPPSSTRYLLSIQWVSGIFLA